MKMQSGVRKKRLLKEKISNSESQKQDMGKRSREKKGMNEKLLEMKEEMDI